MRISAWVKVGTAVLVTLVSVCSLAETFNFEDLPVGTIVKAQYGPRGVIFFGAYIDSDQHAPSRSHVLHSIPPNAEVFTPGPLVMTFTSPKTEVGFRAASYTGSTGQGTLRVFDGNGAVLAQDGPRLVTDSFSAAFHVKIAAAKIVRAEFQIDGTAFESIDDLVVQGTNVTPPPTHPQVTITYPTNNSVLPEGTIAIRGKVTGESLLPTMILRVKMGLPGDSTAPPSQNEVALSGSGTSRTFTLNYGVLTGTYTVTAVATNTANLEGTATVNFSSMPDAISGRFQASGGAATFGNFSFGASQTGCEVAVFANGLIAAVGNQTFIVLGPIFQKWLAVREQGNSMSKLGCPTAEERPALAGARAQDFRHGRIYATSNSTAYVPEVFRDAIETLGGEATTGIATSDPTDSTAAMRTWLFQRFPRADNPSVEPSTLEIRGSPPVLYVERVGDNVANMGGLPLYSTTATVYRTFPCDGNLGPCTVQKPTSPPPLANASSHCAGQYDAADYTIEWQWLSGGDYGQIPIEGWVHSSRMSCKDNPLTHDNIMTNTSCPSSEIPPAGLFPSDWQVYVLPIEPFGDKVTPDQTYLEVEFEEAYALHFFVGWGWPAEGDLIYANGRWIVDCGHVPYKSEIHPPFLTSHMHSQRRPDGTPETVAEIWVNGYYPGDPIDLDLWPPPRPSPNAFLTVIKPQDADAALGVSVALTSSFSGAHVHFTAPRREVPVDHSGKMNWETLRGYEGEWLVYWSLH
jgi:Bacterial Ig domain/LGFP repeat